MKLVAHVTCQLSTLLAFGCATSPSGAKTEPPADDSKPVTTQLLRDCMESDKHYLMSKNQNDGHGLGLTAVSLEGKPVWPPNGPRCENLIACCVALTAADQGQGLFCQFAIGRDGSCAVALQTMTQITVEQRRPVPPPCRE